tara:strand:+ start:9513 stop:10556 length:1044 start_codon:yes stop_codon:yes gene_type:complete
MKSRENKLDPALARKDVGRIRFLLTKLMFNFPVKILGKIIKTTKSKPIATQIRHNEILRFLMCGMSDFILYHLFYELLKIFSKSKRKLYSQKYITNIKIKIDPELDSPARTLEREKIFIFSDELYYRASQHLKPIFSYIDTLTVGSNNTVKLAGIYCYPAYSPHQLILEDFIDEYSNYFTNFFIDSGIDKFLIDYYSTGYEVYNTRVWKSLPFNDKGGYHLDNLPPKVLKIMIFSGDKNSNYFVNRENGSFAYKDFSTKKILSLDGLFPCAVIDTSNLEHRAGCIQPGRSRCAIEFTVRPFYLSHKVSRFYEPGFSAAHPVNPFIDSPTKKATILKPTGLAGFSKTF